MNNAPSTQDHTILKVLVGSHAHGLAGSQSDRDYRSVYIMPTLRMFRLDYKPPTPRWTKDSEDETAWELGLFLSLAVQCHPLVLETFLAPTIAIDAWGHKLRALFLSVWSAQGVYNTFLAYALNQRRKFLDKKDGRQAKYAAAYLRTLHNLCELLETDTFTVRIADTAVGPIIARIKDGSYQTGEVIHLGEQWTEHATRRLAKCTHQADRQVVETFLIQARTSFLSPKDHFPNI